MSTDVLPKATAESVADLAQREFLGASPYAAQDIYEACIRALVHFEFSMFDDGTLDGAYEILSRRLASDMKKRRSRNQRC
jgi:hypothetical protein